MPKGIKENMKILFDKFLPKWNYALCPSQPDFGKLFLRRSLRTRLVAKPQAAWDTNSRWLVAK